MLFPYRYRGTVKVSFDAQTRSIVFTAGAFRFRARIIEVKEKDAVESAYMPEFVLTSDAKVKTEDLRKFYRIIAGDERNTVVLKPAP